MNEEIMKQIVRQSIPIQPNNPFFIDKAKEIRLSILDMVTNSKASHIGSAFSIVDILTVLYHNFLDVQLIKEKSKKRDYFILSKGHSVVALYATIASVGLIPKNSLKDYYKDGSLLAGHPIKDSFPGIEASTGSLGHGLPIAVGLALACKKDNLKNKIYVLLGDGECQEGSVWEAIMIAVQFKLNNLVIIVDNNKLQGLDRTNDVVSGGWEEKFQAFGCSCDVVDGHNFTQLVQAFSFTGKTNAPNLVIANTTKGKGVSYMENKLEWHYKSPKLDEYNLAKEELLKT